MDRLVSRYKIFKSHKDNKVLLTKDMKKIVNAYAKEANKRLEALEQSGYKNSSAAYKQVEEWQFDKREFTYKQKAKNNKVRFKVVTKNRNREEIYQELVRLDKFLFSYKTSTVDKVINKTRERAEKSLRALQRRPLFKDFAEQFKGDLSTEKGLQDFGNFWRENATARLVSIFGSSEGVSIRDDLDGVSDDTINEFLDNYLEEKTKKDLRLMPTFNFVSEVEEFAFGGPMVRD